MAGIFTQPPIQNINQYFSSRSSFGLCFCIYQVKRFSFIKSNQFRLVLIFKTRTKHQTNQQTTTNSSQIFIPSFIANETLLNLVGRLSLVNGDKKSFWKRSSDRSSPNSIRSFSAKDYLSGFRSLREEIENVQTKRNRKTWREAIAANKQNNTQQQTKTKSEFLFFRLGFFKLKIKMKNTRYLHLTNEWKRNEQKKKKISFCFTFFANGPELRPQENGFL